MRATTELRLRSAHESPVEGRCDHMDLSTWFSILRAHAQRQDGQTMAEYGVVLAVITVFVVIALGTLAVAISGKLDSVTGILDAA
jgi:Flp pilus assembly pilin Flp